MCGIPQESERDKNISYILYTVNQHHSPTVHLSWHCTNLVPWQLILAVYRLVSWTLKLFISFMSVGSMHLIWLYKRNPRYSKSTTAIRWFSVHM